MHGDQHRGDRQSGADQLPHRAVQRVVLEIAGHAPAQAMFRPPSHRALAPPLLVDWASCLSACDARRPARSAASRAARRSRADTTPRPTAPARRRCRRAWRRRASACRARSIPRPHGRRESRRTPSRKSRSSRNRSACASAASRDRFAMNEADDRVRRQAERPVGMLVLGLVEGIGLGVAAARPASATPRPPCEGRGRSRSHSTPMVSRSAHTISASRMLPAPLIRSHSGLPWPLPRTRAHDVRAAVEQQHQAGRDHQAAECERGLKRDERAGEHRKDAAAVMRAACCRSTTRRQARRRPTGRSPGRRPARPRPMRTRGAIVAIAPSTSSRMPIVSRRAALRLGSYLTGAAGRSRIDAHIERTTMTHANKAGRTTAAPAAAARNTRSAASSSCRNPAATRCCW